MMFTFRRAAVGATAFFAASAFAAPAAFAETTADLEVAFKGTTLTAGSPEKTAFFTVKNNGPQVATDIRFDLDLSNLDGTKVEWHTEGIACDDPDISDKVKANCKLDPLDPGSTIDFYFTLTRLGGATGAAGSMTVTVKAPQDQNPANNTATTNVVLSDLAGVDLFAWAWDISKEEDAPTGDPVAPGATTFFNAVVLNYGTVASSRLKMEIKLPEGVTFVGNEPDCDYTTGSTRTVCTYTGRAGQVAPQTGERFFFEVKISETVAGPVTLGGGLFTVIDDPQAPAVSARSTGAEPKNVKPFDINDVDVTDNASEFNALVAKGEGQGPLPTTGVDVAVLAGGGVGVLAVGVVLFVVTRRRRITG
jgi:hypothetical protein